MGCTLLDKLGDSNFRVTVSGSCTLNRGIGNDTIPTRTEIHLSSTFRHGLERERRFILTCYIQFHMIEVSQPPPPPRYLYS